MTACGWCGLVFDGAYHYCQTQLRTAATTTADYEAADMVHRNRLGLAREAAAASTVDLLAAEVRALKVEADKLRTELTVATCAALAANDYYLCEYAGLKTYRPPIEIRESFATAIEAYREATGMTGVGDDPCTHDHEMGAITDPDVWVCVTCGQNRG